MQNPPLLDHLKHEINQVKIRIAHYDTPPPGGMSMPTYCPWGAYCANKIIISLLDIVSDLDNRLKAAEEKLQAKKPLEGSSASKQLRDAIASLPK